MIDDELTRSAYKGLCLQQRKEVMDVFPLLLNKINPKRIIEIGTGCGGLALFLKDNLPLTSDLYTFDILSRHYHEALKENNVNLFYENIFEDTPQSWDFYKVKNNWTYLFNVSPKIVLCDGGNKKAEFNGISNLLTQGDIIMLHDYSTNNETFEKLNVWNWLECEYSNIEEMCKVNNLKPYMHEEFLNVAWGCFIKQ